MCIGMANGGKLPEFLKEKKYVDDIGRVQIPKVMREKLGIQEGDILRVTALTEIIVLEKCESESDTE